jgi:hypothetical protein
MFRLSEGGADMEEVIKLFDLFECDFGGDHNEKGKGCGAGF